MSPRRIALAVLALGVLAFVVERLVVTDREAVTALLEDAAAAVSKNDWEKLSGALDDDYAEHGRDRAAFVSYVAGLAKQYKPQGVGIEVAEPTIDGDHAAARVVVKPGAPFIGVRIDGRVDLVRRRDGWRIVGVSESETHFLGR